MATRQIVIELSDRLIKKVQDHYVNPYEVDEICEAILDGTPLPKGHGRLIDADALKTHFVEHHHFFINAYGSFSCMTAKEQARVEEVDNSIASVVNAPTVLEADAEV